MASLEAAADHAQHAAERRCVPFCADQIIVQHNEKAIDGKVQNRRARTVFRAVIRANARILQKRAVLLEAAAEQQSQHQRQREGRKAEQIRDRPVPVACADARAVRKRSAQHPIEHRAQEKGQKSHRNRSRVEIIPLVHLRAVRQPCRQNEANDKADRQRQSRAEKRHAMRIRARIADEKVRHQGRNAGRKQENVSLRAGVHLPHKAGQQHAREAEPDIEHRNAPEAEARRQEIRQHRNAVRLAAGKRINGCADGADNCRVQERPGKAAARRVKIAVG